MTKAGQRVQQRVTRYLENPVKNPLSVIALRRKEPMAKSRRKAPSAKQLAQRAKFAARYGGKKVARRGKKRRAAPAATLTANRAPAKRRQEEEEETMLEENPRKKSKAKRKGKARRRTRKGTRRRKATARRSPRRRSRRRSRAGGRVHVVRFPAAQRVKLIRVKSKTKPKRRRSRRRSRRALALLENPSTVRGNPAYDGLFDNPSLADAYSMDNTKAFVVAAGGIALGLVVARGIDRFVATMKPSDAGALAANNPWYGKNAAAAYNRRPGALRLGVQGLLALGGIGAAYATRNNKYLPWALGGIALGAGSNLMLQVMEWHVLPRIFKIENASDATWQNRLYVLEQVENQDNVDTAFENWGTIPSLAANQTPEPTGITGPGAIPVAVYQLGGAQPNTLAGGGCGCGGGCGGGCGNCNGGGRKGQLCSYVVQPGDDLGALLAVAGIGIESVNALNNGNYWVAGNQVVLPYEMCVSLTGGGTPAMPNGGDGTIMFQPVGPGSAPSSVLTELPGGPVIPFVAPGMVRGTEEPKQHYVPVDAAAEAD